MTKRERFEHFLANKPVDRVPVAFFHHFCGMDEFGAGLENPEAFEKNIEGHRKARKLFDPDVIKVMNDSLMIMPVDLSEVKKAADLKNIKPPAKGSPYMEKSKELTDRILDIYADSDAPKYVTVFSPVMTMRNALNETFPLQLKKPQLVKFLEEDPDAVMKGLDIIAESIMILDEMLVKECGADGIYFSVNNQSHFVPDEMYKEYVAPSDLKVLERANALSDITLLHICGYEGRANNLELFKDYKAAAYNWAVKAEGVSLSEGKKFFKGAPVFGGFEQAGVIYKGSREDVEKAVFDILDDAGQLGVMLGADCTVPTDIDDSRLGWVRDAAIKYSQK